MIVFNFPALIVVAIIIGFNYLIKSYYPDFVNINHPYFWLSFYVFSGIFEMTKLKARVFWIPLWIFGIVGFGISLYHEYEKTNSFIAIIILVVLFVIGYILLKQINKYKWNNAKQCLRDLSLFTQDFSKDSEYRIYMQKANFIPKYLLPDSNFQYMVLEKIYSPLYKKWFSKSDVNSHYIELLNKLKELISEDLYNTKVSMFHTSLLKLKEGRDAYIERYMIENIKSILRFYIPE